MSFDYIFNFDSPINDNLIVDTSFDGTFLLIRYNNGEVIRLNITDLVGYEA